jgi:hypothetical protein
VATIVEEKDINGLQTKQFIRFVVLLKDGTFTSVLMTDCRKAKSKFQQIIGRIMR